MNFWIKYERHINIIAIIFIIIMLLFICYRIVIYDTKINALTMSIANIEANMSPVADGMPEYLGLGAAPVPAVSDVRKIMVNITGAVAEPGVYILEEGSRLIDLIEMAGGAHEYADIERINRAAHLQDASHIRIPFIGDSEYDFALIDVVLDEGVDETGSASAASSGLININTATQAELERLPGIGPVIAGNIIAYRQLHGPFTSAEQLLNVNRVGQAVFNNLRHLITY